MGRDYFAILGLAPGRHEPAEVARRFRLERSRLLAQLDDPVARDAARRQLDYLHLAYAALRDPCAQAEYLRARVEGADDVTRLRQLIAASLEDGLLRYSRRQEILAEARRLGFSEFHTQLLIAQVQFGDDGLWPPESAATRRERRDTSRAWAGFAAAGVLALTLFLALVRWLGG